VWFFKLSNGFSGQVVNLLMVGTLQSTYAAYESAWNRWRDWSIQNGSNPLFTPQTNILEFLSDCFVEGKAYRTINVYRSMFFVNS
jgi:hypothetical protein